MVLTTELLIVTEAVFPWLLTSKHRPLTVRHVHRLETLENLVCESFNQGWKHRKRSTLMIFIAVYLPVLAGEDVSQLH